MNQFIYLSIKRIGSFKTDNVCNWIRWMNMILCTFDKIYLRFFDIFLWNWTSTSGQAVTSAGRGMWFGDMLI